MQAITYAAHGRPADPELTPRPVRLTLRGEYWDSQIYAGALYLFGADGSLSLIDWDFLVAELSIPDELRVVADAAFRGNSRLYGTGAYELLRDSEVRALLLDKFGRLAAFSPEINELGGNWLVRQRKNPLPFPHADSEVHYSRMYVGGASGIFWLNVSGIGAPSDRLTFEQQSDLPAYDLAARYSTLAVAAGSEGLFQIGLGNRRKGDRAVGGAEEIATRACVSCEWSYWSVFASGPDGRGFLAAFDKVQAPQESAAASRRSLRKFKGIVTSDELFLEARSPAWQHSIRDLPGAERPFSWGADDKLFEYYDGQVDVLRYRPGEEESEEGLGLLGQVHIQGVTGEIIGARVAPFGSIIEFDDTLVVLPTKGEPLSLIGEPVSWRVFPRSEHYVNQLHVIYEDRLEIWSFTHDYFVDQAEKLMGTTPFSG